MADTIETMNNKVVELANVIGQEMASLAKQLSELEASDIGQLQQLKEDVSKMIVSLNPISFDENSAIEYADGTTATDIDPKKVSYSKDTIDGLFASINEEIESLHTFLGDEDSVLNLKETIQSIHDMLNSDLGSKPVFEVDENGELVLDEDGNPIPVYDKYTEEDKNEDGIIIGADGQEHQVGDVKVDADGNPIQATEPLTLEEVVKGISENASAIEALKTAQETLEGSLAEQADRIEALEKLVEFECSPYASIFLGSYQSNLPPAKGTATTSAAVAPGVTTFTVAPDADGNTEVSDRTFVDTVVNA